MSGLLANNPFKKNDEKLKQAAKLVDKNNNIIMGRNNSMAFDKIHDSIVIGNDATATSSGQLVLGSESHPILSTHTVGKSGNAIATPQAPEEYLIINFNGKIRKIPLYNQ